MAQETGQQNEKRINIPFLEGVNSLVGYNIAKKTELVHAENARSLTIGTIEKRAGQKVLGTNSSSQPFITTANYGLFPFTNDITNGLYRISTTESSTLSINVVDQVFAGESIELGGDFTLAATTPPYTISVADSVTATDVFNEVGKLVTIYYINSDDRWIPLTGSGASIPGGVFDYTYAEGNVFLVNLNSANRYISSDSTTVTTSSTGGGHLYNTPPASKINFYKERLYLADFVQNQIRYKTTILQSSYPMGIIALVNADYDSTAATTVQVTDNKYFYTDSGANSYDIYRGTTKITTITVTTINETNLTVTGTITGILASDEIWIAGTYDGEKVFRWINNPTVTGKNVQQYDSFKLSGGENDPITMMTNIGNVMLISNKNTMSSWNDYTLENFDLDIGCVSKKGYVKMLGTLYFLHYTGVYATSGSVPRLISNKIEKYITGATKTGKEQSAAGKKGRSIFFTLGDVTLYNPDGSTQKTISDVCIEYNLIQENWFIHKNVKASEFATFVESSDSDRLEFTDTSGNLAVKEFLSGTTDDGTEIDFRVDTINLTLQPTKIEATSKPMALIIESERGAGMNAYVSLDGNAYYPIEGAVKKGLSVLKINNKDEGRSKPPTARVISVSLRDTSKQLCKVSRMSIVHLPTNEEVANNQ